jgi:diadenosine tetraphosphatase ApaH/serine/threonine PP2A family protein phosphatase
LRYLIISDIHANLEALDATLAAAGSYDRALVLGDLVGYGADPNAVIDRVRALPDALLIRGNHDKVGAGLETVDGFNHLARFAIAWTTATLTPDNREWLAQLAQGPAIVDDEVEICHGTPFDEDVYVFDDLDALRAIGTARRPLCLFGHTHVPAVYRRAPGGELSAAPMTTASPLEVPLREGHYLINVGAVGQPRDGDSRAAFGFYDTGSRTITLARASYDIAGAQAKIISAGLPDVLAQRLAVGR